MSTAAAEHISLTSPAKSDRGRAEAWNPLATEAAAQWSSYLGPLGAALVPLLDPSRSPDAAELTVHERLRRMVLRPEYPCLGARSSFHRRLYRLGVYPEMGLGATARVVCHDLYEFAHELEQPNVRFATFIASFLGPRIRSELHFEHLLWAQLQQMHDIDARLFRWDPSVSSDPEDPWFSFSIGGHAYYIVGLHPLATRLARRLTYPSIVFNLHTQFALLGEQGRLDLFKKAIRSRDIALQGSINPTLINYASGSQARQYSGRAVEPGWRCPLRVAA